MMFTIAEVFVDYPNPISVTHYTEVHVEVTSGHTFEFLGLRAKSNVGRGIYK